MQDLHNTDPTQEAWARSFRLTGPTRQQELDHTYKIGNISAFKGLGREVRIVLSARGTRRPSNPTGSVSYHTLPRLLGVSNGARISLTAISP